jgi:hypothetical protein
MLCGSVAPATYMSKSQMAYASEGEAAVGQVFDGNLLVRRARYVTLANADVA